MPVDDLRDRIAEALRAHHIDLTQTDRAQEADRCVCGELVDDWDAHWVDTALAVVSPELERLRGELAKVTEQRDDNWAAFRRMCKAGEIAEGHMDLMTQMRDAERQRAEQAEDRLRVTTDAYTRLQAQADAAEAARARWQQRGTQAEAAIERVRALTEEWRSKLPDEPWAATARHVCAMILAALDAPSADRWQCPRCGSDRWVAASLTGPVEYGGRAIKQCVPCGYYSGDSADAPSGADSHQNGDTDV